jgi:hypothetical protein
VQIVIPKNSLHFIGLNLKNQGYPPECYTKLKIKTICSNLLYRVYINVNHSKYVTSQLNGFAAVLDRKVFIFCLAMARGITSSKQSCLLKGTGMV